MPRKLLEVESATQPACWAQGWAKRHSTGGRKEREEPKLERINCCGQRLHQWEIAMDRNSVRVELVSACHWMSQRG